MSDSAANRQELPDPGSFGGHPYTPDEIAKGYGTDHDPRFNPPTPAERAAASLRGRVVAWRKRRRFHRLRRRHERGDTFRVI